MVVPELALAEIAFFPGHYTVDEASDRAGKEEELWGSHFCHHVFSLKRETLHVHTRGERFFCF